MKLVKRKEKGEGNLTCSAPPGFFTSVNKTKRRRRVPDLYDPPWDLLNNQLTSKMYNIVAQKRVRWWEREREAVLVLQAERRREAFGGRRERRQTVWRRKKLRRAGQHNDSEILASFLLFLDVVAALASHMI